MPNQTIPPRRRVLTALTALTVAASANAQPSSPVPAAGGAPSPRRSAAVRGNQQPVEIIRDAHVQSFSLGQSMTGQPWQIHLAVPRTRVPERGAPALYLLDGNATFPLAWHALAQLRQTFPALAERLDTLVLIGVGYPSGLRIDTPRRYEDFTAYTPLEFRQARGSDLTTGGRDVFRSFLAGPLRDAVRQRVKLDTQAQSLLGHSMGGQFAMHVLYCQPGLFQRYIAGDPSFWWNGSALLQEQAAFIAGIQAAGGRLARPLHVLLENSGPTAQEHPHPAAPLAHLQGLPLWRRQQVDASHGSMLAALVEDAIVFALGAIPSQAQRWERAA